MPDINITSLDGGFTTKVLVGTGGIDVTEDQTFITVDGSSISGGGSSLSAVAPLVLESTEGGNEISITLGDGIIHNDDGLSIDTTWDASFNSLAIASGVITLNADGSMGAATGNFSIGADGTLVISNSTTQINPDGSAGFATGAFSIDTDGSIHPNNVYINGTNSQLNNDGSCLLANGALTIGTDGSLAVAASATLTIPTGTTDPETPTAGMIWVNGTNLKFCDNTGAVQTVTSS